MIDGFQTTFLVVLNRTNAQLSVQTLLLLNQFLFARWPQHIRVLRGGIGDMKCSSTGGSTTLSTINTNIFIVLYDVITND